MKIQIFVIASLFVLISGCAQQAGGGSTPGASTDCGIYSGSGQACFKSAMASCAPATVVLYEGVPPVSAKIIGPAVGGSTCTVSVTGIGKPGIDDALARNGASQEQISRIDSIIDGAPGFSGLAGKNASCVVEKLKVDSFAGSYVYSCSGPLIDAISQQRLAEKFS